MNTSFDDPPEEIKIPVHVDMAGWDPVWVSVSTEEAYALQEDNEREEPREVPKPER